MRPLCELMDLTGRSALVTGGAGRIGYAAAQALVELGAKVAVLDLDAGACAERARELDSIRAGSSIAVPCDLADEAATRAACREAVERLGGLDVLIHSAAFVGTTQVPGWSARFDQQTTAAWDAGMRVNVTSAFVLAQEARPALAASGYGSIVFVSSIYGLVGSDPTVYEGSGMNPDRVVAYSASKGALTQMMRHLATIFAPHIRVNAISPGGVARGQPGAFQSRYEARTPLKRMAREEDLKGAFAYLSSDLSAYVTGHDLVVDGGWTAW